jgi:lipoprotein-anchoring transpeptidase ErfK/SrfK
VHARRRAPWLPAAVRRKLVLTAVSLAVLLLAGCLAGPALGPQVGGMPAVYSDAGTVTHRLESLRSAPQPGVSPAQSPAPSPAAAPPQRPAARQAAALALPARSGSGRRVVYSKSRQRVWLVRGDGTVARTYAVSGQLSQPDPGSYRVYSTSRHTSSAVSDATMGFMVRFTRGKRTGAAIGFHDIPRRPDGTYEQTAAELGEPISAGCIRQRRADARALWNFAPVGTRVVVTR